MNIILNEKSFMNKVAMGDNKTCRRLVVKYLPMVQSVAIRMMGNKVDGEDISQEVFIKVWRFADKFDGKSSIKSWLYKIVINTCLDTLKVRKKTYELNDEIVCDNSQSVDKTIFKNQQSEKIKQTLDALKPTERSIILLFYWEELKIKEIASIIGISESATESSLRRARGKLGYLLQSEDIK